MIWLALVYWTYADARRRIDDPMLVGCATAASLFPFIGTIVYTIVRPPEYLEDVHERELEIKAAETRLALLENRTAATAAPRSSRASCAARAACGKLRSRAASCGKPLDPRWRVCPYCEAEVGQAALRPGADAPAQRRRRHARRAPAARGRRARATRERQPRPAQPPSERPHARRARRAPAARARQRTTPADARP